MTEARDIVLEEGPEGLAARVVDDPSIGVVRVDFLSGPLGHRLRQRPGRKLPLARAIGVKEAGLQVIDATLGLGRDAFLLACLGCEVRAYERCSMLVDLVRDGLRRAAASERLGAAARRLTIEPGDAAVALGQLVAGAGPDVVYLDPMFPPRRRETALVKKEMRLVHRLVGREEPTEATRLWEAAMACETGRVVVKRHGSAPALGPGVSHEVRGKSVRYDVYLREPV
ncbi:MAG: class I SAM-dependent methyltransferase [Phycisphaerales bacterium JB038]